MPKTKARKPSTSDSDSGPDDRTPAKKSKAATSSSKNNSRGDEEDSWELGNNRFLKLTEFKGKWYVNIREYYNADGEMRPGKKGIMMSMPQWQKFKDALPELDEAIKRRV